jgi:hypothetical protein
MNIHNLNMSVGGILPEYDRELTEDKNNHAATHGIVFNKIRMIRWKSGDGAKAFKEALIKGRFSIFAIGLSGVLS